MVPSSTSQKSFNNLTGDDFSSIASFMSTRDTLAFINVNRQTRESCEPILRRLYHENFGEIDFMTSSFGKGTIARLVSSVNINPNYSRHNNVYKIPDEYLSDASTIEEMEAVFTGKVQKVYNQNIALLENTQATSIIQLRNQLYAFWHCDRQIKNYAQYRQSLFQGPAREEGPPTNRPMLEIGKKLQERARETFAKIGKFQLDHSAYDVAAFHALRDEATLSMLPGQNPEFGSVHFGRTYVGIFRSEESHSIDAVGCFGINHNVGIQLARKVEVGSSTYCEEDGLEHREIVVTDEKRHLFVGKHLNYRDSTNNLQGSDRLLDQKLTQIMVEIGLQNKGISSIQVESKHDDFPILTAGGFRIGKRFAQKTLSDLAEFRGEEINRLFPPSVHYSKEDYRDICIDFKMRKATKKNISFSKDTSEAWVDIIQREPILTPGAAILPEYWEIRPNVV